MYVGDPHRERTVVWEQPDSLAPSGFRPRRGHVVEASWKACPTMTGPRRQGGGRRSLALTNFSFADRQGCYAE